MVFCPKCNSMLMPRKNKLKCRCGYTKEAESEIIKEQYTAKGEEKEKKEVILIDEDVITLPTTQGKCYRCGNTKIAWWMQQTRSADEAPTIFYRCVKCGNTWKGKD